MFSQTSPKLGSFDVLQLQPGNSSPLPGVQDVQYPKFCLSSEADALASAMVAKLNDATDGSNGTAVAAENGEEASLFMFMTKAAPRLYIIAGSYFHVQQTYTVSESAGELLARQTTPLSGIDKTPYKDPANPQLFFTLVAGAVRFGWE